MLVSPGRSPPGTQRPAVQGSGDAAQRPTALAQASDLREGRLFARVRLNVLAVFGETIAELDGADAFTASLLVAQSGAGGLGHRLPLPLAEGAYDRDDQPTRHRTGVQRFG